MQLNLVVYTYSVCKPRGVDRKEVRSVSIRSVTLFITLIFSEASKKSLASYWCLSVLGNSFPFDKYPDEILYHVHQIDTTGI